MSNATTETAKKMLQLIDLTTDHGKLTWLMIAFLHDTRASFHECASLRISDVYKNGNSRKTLALGQDQRRRTAILGPHTRKIVEALLLLSAKWGHQASPDTPLFRLPSGNPFQADQMARLFWLYQEAAEVQGKTS